MLLFRHWILFCVSVLVAVTNASAEDGPAWIWADGNRSGENTVAFRTTFLGTNEFKRVELWLANAYCDCEVFVNGESQHQLRAFQPPSTITILSVRPGENELTFVCRGVKGPSALAARLQVNNEATVSGSPWQVSKHSPPPAGVQDLDSTKWTPAKSFGAIADRVWNSDGVATNVADDYTQWKRALEQTGSTEAEQLQVPIGFQAELLYSAGENEGSWISLAEDPKGRWVIGHEDEGLMRITLDDNAPPTAEQLAVASSECRGLVFAHDSLYVMGNKTRSLYRLRDTNDDDQFDNVQKLKEFAGGTGHGRNQLTLGPDGKIYIICGDSVQQPTDATYLPPLIPDPDDVQNKQNGFVARTDPDGTNWEVVVRGLRNPYGIDFNANGDFFTYDADAEYDMGSSWYRPTRVLHLLPSSDYGWRAVTRRWPPYNPDSATMPQPMLDIGRGSPTAVEFAAGDNFPAPYRDALFVLDWSYGRILAVHMQPSGASYAAGAEVFLRGSPLNVTDLEFGSDGAMYFVTGGRKTQSGLYRVRYVGEQVSQPPPSAQQIAVGNHAKQARQRRQKLESLRGSDSSVTIETAWMALDASDPWIRHAARTAIESMPVAMWRDRAANEANTNQFLAGALALQRFGDDDDREMLRKRLGGLDVLQLLPWQQVEWADLCLRQLADADANDAKWDLTFEKLQSVFPSNRFALDQPTSELLAQRDDGVLVPLVMPLFEASVATGDQRQQMHWLLMLSTQRRGWTPTLRERYLVSLQDMDAFESGEGMPTFRRLIREAAIANLPNDLQAEWQLSFDSNSTTQIPELPPARTTIVKQWSIDDYRNSLTEPAADIQRGKEMFALARCIVCHRVGPEGGVSGPDLTGVSRRFSTRDLLVSILEPSAVVSEKYANTMFELSDGRVLMGRTRVTDYRSPTAELIPDLLLPDKKISFSKQQIVQRRVSPVSPMPKGLVDGLTKQEVLDLIAYLRSQ